MNRLKVCATLQHGESKIVAGMNHCFASIALPTWYFIFAGIGPYSLVYREGPTTLKAISSDNFIICTGNAAEIWPETTKPK